LLVVLLLLSFDGVAAHPVPPTTASPPILQPSAAVATAPAVLEGLAAEKRFDSKTALAAFLRADDAHPNDAFILQKISRQYSDLTIDATSEAEKKRLCVEALAYGKRAAELQPDNAVHLLSLGISYGKLGLYSDIRTRIEYSRLVRQYAEQALALNPDYDYAHHVLGRWHYEVSSLGGATKFFVRLVYGGLPPASTREAVRLLKRAVELSPACPAHRVELGFALLSDGQRQAARKMFDDALSLPPQEKYDLEACARAREALARLK
jgi:tetratricopeptide (TPR) repeat protein